MIVRQPTTRGKRLRNNAVVMGSAELQKNETQLAVSKIDEDFDTLIMSEEEMHLIISEKALEKIKLKKEIEKDIEQQLADQPPVLREDEEGFIVGANALQHAMGMTTDGMGLTFNTEVVPSDDEEEEYIKDLMAEELDVVELENAVEIDDDSFKITDVDPITILENGIEDEMNGVEKEDVDEDYEQWRKKQKELEWSIIYSKKPELIIDRDEYDKILINLLQSYQ